MQYTFTSESTVLPTNTLSARDKPKPLLWVCPQPQLNKVTYLKPAVMFGSKTIRVQNPLPAPHFPSTVTNNSHLECPTVVDQRQNGVGEGSLTPTSPDPKRETCKALRS